MRANHSTAGTPRHGAGVVRSLPPPSQRMKLSPRCLKTQQPPQGNAKAQRSSLAPTPAQDLVENPESNYQALARLRQRCSLEIPRSRRRTLALRLLTTAEQHSTDETSLCTDEMRHWHPSPTPCLAPHPQHKPGPPTWLTHNPTHVCPPQP